MKFRHLALIAFCVALLTGCQPENYFGLHQVGDNYEQHYSWWYSGKLYNMNLSFPVRTYWHYRSKPKTLPYSDYVSEDKGFEYINYVAGALNEQVAGEHLSDAEMANFVLAFAQQSVPYVRDPIGPTDYPRYAIETLCDMGGDCEDKSAVCCSILLAYKLDAVLVQVPGHEFVAISCPGIDGYYCIYNNKRYFYGETTNSGWTWGNAPDLVRNAPQVTILPVERTAFFDRFHPNSKSTAYPLRKNNSSTHQESTYSIQFTKNN